MRTSASWKPSSRNSSAPKKNKIKSSAANSTTTSPKSSTPPPTASPSPRTKTSPLGCGRNFKTCANTSRAPLSDVRTLARELRPALLDHFGFAAAIKKHADDFRQRTRLTLDLHLQPETVSFLDTDDLTHLFRLTQEALRNIEEHSRANRAWIRLHDNDGCLHLEIGDDGCSFTPERVTEAQADGHLGLLSMRERAELLGGTFHLDGEPQRGTVIRVIIPFPESGTTEQLIA